MIRTIRTGISVAALVLGLIPALWGSGPLDTLQPKHPRLLFSDTDLPQIRRAIESDPFVRQQYQELLTRAETFLSAPPDKYELTGPEHTLLTTARDLEDRIFTLAALYRITGDKRYARRATDEMLAVAAYPNWANWHFLDTAETTAAMGIGYDWLYSTLSPQDRKTIHDALVSRSIDPWLAMIGSGKAHYANNWVEVCNGGETIGALAIASEDPDRAEQVLAYAKPAMAEIMKLYAPDGGFEEGPVYWSYATIYNVLYIDALDTALGTDFGAADSPGFAITPQYRIQTIGPTNLLANFGDANPSAAPAPQMFWFARRFDRPAYATLERGIESSLDGHMDAYTQKDSERFSALGLFWDAAVTGPNKAEPPPLASYFSRVSQVYMRSAWYEPLAWFIGFKGGDARAGHAHLDLGSFVFDALGQRWGMDLGTDNYGLPGYFGAQRWSYYRLRTEGHNTLTVDDQNEDLDAVAPLAVTGQAFAIADLGSAYKKKLKAWKRGIALLSGSEMLVEDEVVPNGNVAITWNFHTAANVQIAADGRSAILTQNGTAITTRILSPPDARFTLANAQMNPPQASNRGVINLVIALQKQAGPSTIAVIFASSSAPHYTPLRPLNTWH